MNNEKLEKILLKHEYWLRDNNTGEKANLSGAYLRGADLMGTDLMRADLRYADLIGADLRGTDLSGADLSGANLRGTILIYANLRGVTLRYADLRYADLRGADLRGTDLMAADLRYADLRGADLRGTDLMAADLSGADLMGADLRETDMNKVKYNVNTNFYAMCCPEKGAFIGFKKCKNKIIELQIPEDALRSSATSRNCRCSKAKVISITELNGTKSQVQEVHSDFDREFVYAVGKTIEVKDFNTDRWAENSPGIHFFITRTEAVCY